MQNKQKLSEIPRIKQNNLKPLHKKNRAATAALFLVSPAFRPAHSPQV